MAEFERCKSKAMMRSPPMQWEEAIAALWSSFDQHDAEAFVQRVEALASDLPSDHPAALFERACAQDSTGRPELAIPLYRQALGQGLTGYKQRRATIQLASSLRNTGAPAEAVDLLSAALRGPRDELSAAVRGFLALALADLGREREALMHSLTALSEYLPRYNRSLANYAADLVAGDRT